MGYGDVEKERRVEFRLWTKYVKLGCSEADAIGKVSRDAALAVLKAGRDFGNYNVAVAKVGVSLLNLFERLRLVQHQTAVLANGFHRNERNVVSRAEFA